MAAFAKMANVMKKATHHAHAADKHETKHVTINQSSPTSDDKKSKLSDLVKAKKASAIVDKLKNRKRDGTPEKSGTPSQDALQDDSQVSARNIIWNEEIEKLQIKDEELSKVREPCPPSAAKTSAQTEKHNVRKMKPASELKPKPLGVTISKPAPHDAEIKPINYAGFAGPRYDGGGHVVPHSILGGYEDFASEAMQRGDLLNIPVTTKPEGAPLSVSKYEKKKKRRHDEDQYGRNLESNALRNWEVKMMERKKQQNHLSKQVQKKPEDLAMNQADNFRAIQEDRYIVDRTIPAVDYGKGYRVGSEFWKQQERFGDDLTGVHRPFPSMTLTQTEKGYPPPIEHIGVPAKIREEKGSHWSPTHTRPMHYPWHKSNYLEQRKKQLMPYEEELDPHKPDYDGLEVIGVANPCLANITERSRTDSRLMMDELERRPPTDMDMEEAERYTGEPGGTPATPGDFGPSPVFGPSLMFAGQPAQWSGDSFGFKGEVGVEARVNFETLAGDRVTSYLTVMNNGTTSIYYSWKKLPKANHFNLKETSVQRFYFNNSSGIVLPGETMKFPFVFKSPNAGVFQEQWLFETMPTVCGGAALIVTLRGIAFAEDKFLYQRRKLQSELREKEAEQMMQHLLEEIVGGMRTPERPSSPIDAYITDQEIFNRCNPKLHYHHDAVEELKKLYIEIAEGDEREGRTWDLCVDDLKDDILEMDEDDERKEMFLHQLNNCVCKMSFIPQKPVHKQLYKAGYQLLVEAVDDMVGQMLCVRQVMGLPDREFDDFNDSDGRGRKSGTGEKSVPKGPEKKTPTPAPKDKGGKMSKESTKADIKSGKQSATPSAPRGPPSRGKTSATLDGSRADKPGSPNSAQSNMVQDDPVLEKKYREKVFAQTYAIVGDTMEKMDYVFDEIIRTDENRRQLQP